MPCTEITEAINWSKQSTIESKFPVLAYLTRHFGMHVGQPSSLPDVVHYASGEVSAQGSPSRLKGTLSVAKNTNKPGVMVSDASITYDVEIFSDGKITYLQKINGQPAGGNPATTVLATCVNNVLLTATHDSTFMPGTSEVIAVGVALQKAQVVSPP
jgi:hypothetical protein